MSTFFRKLRWLTERSRKEAELREELQFHLEEEAEERRAGGMTEEEAAWAARRDLGSLPLVQEDTRAAWGWTFLEQIGQDVRYAVRTIAVNRLFTLLAVVSLALGIGANTAIYSFIDAILLRALPVADPGSLVVLNWHAQARRDSVMRAMSGTTYSDPGKGVTAGIFPFPAFELLQKSEQFSSLFGYYQSHRAKSLNLMIGGRADVGSGQFVSGEFFRGLAVVPAAGRLLVSADDEVGTASVVVVSYAFSHGRFGGAANAVGQSILIDSLPFTVIGVTPPEFFGVDPAIAPDVYLPMHAGERLGASEPFGFRPSQYLADNYYWVQIMGRLRPGVTRAQAEVALAPVFRQWVETTAANDRERANLPALSVDPGAAGLDSLRRRYSQPLYVLLTLVGLILALACVTTANLLLARATARRREIALRLGLGAGRWRIVRQLLTESIVLASLGGLLGVLFAVWGMRVLTLLLANGRPEFTLHAELNWHVLAVAAVLSVSTGLLFGLVPALQATRVELIPALKEARPGQAQAGASRWRRLPTHMFVVCQIAISLLLLVAAGLFVRTLSNLQAIELGFTREQILLFQVDARRVGLDDAALATFYADLRTRLGQLPGVERVSLSQESLIEAGFGLPLGLAGEAPDRANRIMMIGPEFFKTMQIPVLAGRDVSARDRAGAPAVAVINETFAKINFAGRSPLGQRLTLRQPKPGGTLSIARDMEIVGVSRDARYGGLTEAIPPVVYMPYDQGYPYPNQMVFALRTSADPLGYVSSVREVVRLADARVPVSEIRTQAADVERTINQEVTLARLCSGFALLALVIACVGLYGTVSYNVASRTSEIGIRMALGARRGTVVRMVLRDVLLVAGAGLAIGLLAALSTSAFLASFLYGLEPNDPIVLTSAVATLLAAVVLAGYVPARRASRIDPMIAVRHE